MAGWQEHLQRWEEASVVDATTVEQIRAFEAQQEQPAEHRWQVAVLLSLGVILLAGGLMLFVASHWDQVSPWQRLSLVLGFLAIFHAMAAVSAKRFPGMAMALHGIGTVGAGAAILTVGQIFNMQEHWPTAVLLWAICAGAGWWLLRDQVQQTITILLVPTWFICEWSFRAEGYSYTDIYLSRMTAVLAAVLITGLVRYRRRGVFWALFVVGALDLLCSVPVLSEGWTNSGNDPMVPTSLRVAATGIIVATVICGWLQKRRNLLPVLATVFMSYLLPWRHVYKVQDLETYNGLPYFHDEPGAAMYALIAATSIVLAWWGLREKSRAVVNFAIAAFAMTILWFYFSSLMDKLGRSLGLIGLGILFLAGGWLLERLRRKLMAGITVEAS